MTPNYNLCDVCGGKVDERLRLFIVTDRQMDAAGSYEDVGESLDLCPAHQHQVIQVLLGGRIQDRDQGKRVLEFIKKAK